MFGGFSRGLHKLTCNCETHWGFSSLTGCRGVQIVTITLRLPPMTAAAPMPIVRMGPSTMAPYAAFAMVSGRGPEPILKNLRLPARHFWLFWSGPLDSARIRKTVNLEGIIFADHQERVDFECLRSWFNKSKRSSSMDSTRSSNPPQRVSVPFFSLLISFDLLVP